MIGLPAHLRESRAANDLDPPVPPRGRGCSRVPFWLSVVLWVALIAVVTYWLGIGF